MGDHAVHAVADGGDARVRAGAAVRPVPRARAARVRGQAGAVDRGAAAARRRGRRLHRLHGHRRQVAQEVPRPRRAALRAADPDLLLHRHLRLPPPRPLPAPQLQLHHRRLPRRRRHVPQLLHHRLGRLPPPPQPQQWRRRRGLLADGGDAGGEDVQLPERAGGRGVRVRGAQRGAGDPGDDPVDAGAAVQGADVARRRAGLRRRGRLLPPRGGRGVLRVRQRRGRQRAHHAGAAGVADRRRQHVRRRARRRQLPDLRHARVRHARDLPRQEAPLQTRHASPPHRPITLRL